MKVTFSCANCSQCFFFSFISEDYKSHFANRNLLAYSTHPLLVQPCHYAGDKEWVSDTETSTLWDDDNVRTDWRGSHKTLKGSQTPAGLQSATYKDELWGTVLESEWLSGSLFGAYLTQLAEFPQSWTAWKISRNFRIGICSLEKSWKLTLLEKDI